MFKIIRINQLDEKDTEILLDEIPFLAEAQIRLQAFRNIYENQTSFKSTRVIDNYFEIMKSDGIKITEKYIIKIIDL